MTAVLVYADAVPTTIAEALDRSGNTWKAAATAEAVARHEPADGWAGAIVVRSNPEDLLYICRTLREREKSIAPIIAVFDPSWIETFTATHDLFDDFILHPCKVDELEMRLSIALWRARGGTQPNLVEYGDIRLDVATYQAVISGRPLDLTYMEYELLKHFLMNPGRAYTREQLLQEVWGYEYYGGARTVDVHVRRLRAKVGEEHAPLIQTVRSVGYMFGKARW